MRFIFLFVLLNYTITGFCSTNSSDIKSIKRDMIRAVESAHVTDSLYTVLSSKKAHNALIIGYIGTLEALKAKHSWNPYNKIKYVAQSQKTLKTALALAPDNLEIRFMRFSIQYYTPSFLGFSKDLDRDRKLIVGHYTSGSFGVTDREMIKAIADFMLKSDECTDAEEKILRQYV